MRSKRTGLVAIGAVAMLGAIGACSSDASGGGDTSITAANVRITLMDGTGSRQGQCSGVLINATSVLLPAHCVVGKRQWKVYSPASGLSATAEVAYTYDWNNYASNASRPDRHDIAVLRLDTGIELQEYPKLATYPLTNHADSAMRMHANGDGFDTVPAQVTMASTKGFKYAYAAKMGADETLDTGGALYGADGKTLYGIVSGKGTKSGLLYVSRVDSLIEWVSTKSQCGGVRLSNTACLKDSGVCLKDSGSGSTSKPADAGKATGQDAACAKDAGSVNGGGTGGSGGSGGSAGGGGSCGDTPGTCWGNCNGAGSGGAGGTNGGSGSGGSGSGSAGGGDGTGGSGSGSAGGSAGDGTGGSSSGGGGASYGDGTGGSGSGGAADGPGGCDGYPNCVDNVVDYGDCGCYGTTDSPALK